MHRSDVRLRKSVLLAAAMLAGGGLTSGCTRTSDGSVVLARPMAMPSFGLNAPARTYEPPPVVQQLQPSDAPVVAQVAPVRPARPARRVVPEVKMWKPAMVKAPFVPSESSKQLACRNETSAGGRVRVVCE
jgi:hypothetical protein